MADEQVTRSKQNLNGSSRENYVGECRDGEVPVLRSKLSRSDYEGSFGLSRRRVQSRKKVVQGSAFLSCLNKFEKENFV